MTHHKMKSHMHNMTHNHTPSHMPPRVQIGHNDLGHCVRGTRNAYYSAEDKLLRS